MLNYVLIKKLAEFDYFFYSNLSDGFHPYVAYNLMWQSLLLQSAMHMTHGDVMSFMRFYLQ